MRKMYYLQELHYINNIKYWYDLYSNDDFLFILEYRNVFKAKFKNSVLRIVEVV